jgi:hypothetical protein
MFALAKSNCPGKAAVHSILFAKDFILQPKQPACFQQLKNIKIQNTTIDYSQNDKTPGTTLSDVSVLCHWVESF